MQTGVEAFIQDMAELGFEVTLSPLTPISLRTQQWAAARDRLVAVRDDAAVFRRQDDSGTALKRRTEVTLLPDPGPGSKLTT